MVKNRNLPSPVGVGPQIFTYDGTTGRLTSDAGSVPLSQFAGAKEGHAFPTIFIEAGHNTRDVGTQDPGAVRTLHGKTIREADINRAASLALAQEMARRGYHVILSAPDINTRGGDDETRQTLAKVADYVVSLHADTRGPKGGAGVQVHWRRTDANKQPLGEDSLGARFARSIKADLPPVANDFYILNPEHIGTQTAAVLVEMGNMDNKGDLAKLVDPNWQANFAKQLAGDIHNFHQNRDKPAVAASMAKPEPQITKPTAPAAPKAVAKPAPENPEPAAVAAAKPTKPPARKEVAVAPPPKPVVATAKPAPVAKPAAKPVAAHPSVVPDDDGNYTVKKGDTLLEIAATIDRKDDGLTRMDIAREIARKNGIAAKDMDRLAVGTTLDLPTIAPVKASAAAPAAPRNPAIVVVEEGDTLWQIAKRYDTPGDALDRAEMVQMIAAFNGIRPRDRDHLSVGQELKIPKELLGDLPLQTLATKIPLTNRQKS